jgi:integrase
MAYITKRGDLQWLARIRRHGWPEQTRTFETREAAVRWARKIEREIDQGCFVDLRAAETTTLHQLLARYLRDVTPMHKGAKQEALRLKAWQASKLAQRPVAAVRPEDIAQWRDDRLAKGKSPATVTHDLATLSAVFTKARREWSIPVQNPVKEIEKPGLGKQRDRRLEGDEEIRLLKACDQGPPWLRTMVVLAIETAMRQGELRTLAWRDVDLTGSVARLQDTKNGEPRQVPLSSSARAVLAALPVAIDGGPVFGVEQSRVVNAFKAACSRAKITGLRFHDLRHEATSRLFEHGLNVVEAASVTGHKSLQMLKRYSHPRASDLAKRLG